ncbi:MAG: hypothetical protein WBA77_21165 [Microcoleaceae cyanobacterium]
MNQPFIIWTMRRTGGTSLANILGILANKKVEHEPFNWDRSFGDITKTFQNDYKNFNLLEQSLEARCFSAQINVKHCYEIAGQVFNDAIIDIFSKSCYKHIMLTRQNELLRLLSLYTAKYTEAWGKHGSEEIYKKYKSGIAQLPNYDIADMQYHANHCNQATDKVRQKLIDYGVNVYEVSYEDLFTDAKSLDQRKEILSNLCQHIGIDSNLIKYKEMDYSYLLMKNKQSDFDIYDKIPNLSEIKSSFSDYSFEN